MKNYGRSWVTVQPNPYCHGSSVDFIAIIMIARRPDWALPKNEAANQVLMPKVRPRRLKKSIY
jgi:hypothetical protein